jgi:hypothetical protein
MKNFNLSSYVIGLLIGTIFVSTVAWVKAPPKQASGVYVKGQLVTSDIQFSDTDTLVLKPNTSIGIYNNTTSDVIITKGNLLAIAQKPVVAKPKPTVKKVIPSSSSRKQTWDGETRW